MGRARERTGAAAKAAADVSTRERILQGGAEAIGRLGLARARVQDILQASGVSRPTYYHHFESKEALFMELSARHHGGVREQILAAVAAVEDPAQLATAVVRTFLRWRAELGPIGRVLDLEARSPGSVVAHHRRKTLQSLLRLGAELMQAQGRDPVDPVMWYALIAANECIADQLLTGARPSAAAIERATAIGVRLLGAALAGPEDELPPLPPPPVAGRGHGSGGRP